MLKTRINVVVAMMDAHFIGGWCPNCLALNIVRATHHLQHHQVRRRWVKQGEYIRIVEK